MELTTCPECGRPAEVVRRDVLASTDEPIEHARVTCIDRHWFYLPVARLERAHRSQSRPGAPLKPTPSGGG